MERSSILLLDRRFLRRSTHFIGEQPETNPLYLLCPTPEAQTSLSPCILAIELALLKPLLAATLPYSVATARFSGALCPEAPSSAQDLRCLAAATLSTSLGGVLEASLRWPRMLQYLGRYTRRVAISNHRLVSFADGQVTFRWRDSADHNKQKLLTVRVDEFLRRFLLHLLPEGFVRIRNFGFLANRPRSSRYFFAVANLLAHGACMARCGTVSSHLHTTWRKFDCPPRLRICRLPIPIIKQPKQPERGVPLRKFFIQGPLPKSGKRRV
jgi:hypothetical protein